MIETDRLKLRLMDRKDFESIYKIFTDKNVLAAFNITSFSEEQMQSWIDRNINHQGKYGYGLFSVILKTNGELIGDCGLEHTDFKGKSCVELGYDFLSKYWNQGYATEAANAVKNLAIEKLKINSNLICSFIRKTNIASQRVSEKIGMHKIIEYKKGDVDYFLYGFSSELTNENRFVKHEIKNCK